MLDVAVCSTAQLKFSETASKATFLSDLTVSPGTARQASSEPVWTL